MKEKKDVVAFLSTKVALFKKFPEARLSELVASSQVTTIEANEAIIEFGEEGRFLGVLLDGSAEVSVADESGARRRISVLSAGDLFGEMAIMTGDRTVADIIGISRCTVLLIPQSLFSTALITHPPAIQYLSKIIAERSRKLATDDQQCRELADAAISRSGDPYGFKLKSDEPSRILVINCGSSSLKYQLFNTADEKKNARGMVEGIGSTGAMRHTSQSEKGPASEELPSGTHKEAFAAMTKALSASGALGKAEEISAVGHRVVHGGAEFSGAEIVTDEVIKKIEALSPLAPLHNPVNLIGINQAKTLFPKAVQVAVFDTAFHHTLPPYAYLYGLPYQYAEEKKIRRYGFHGMSHAYVALKAAEHLKKPYGSLEIISCHLGNGASVCAIDHGRSVDTSMGLTPLEGLIMGTRCGSVDPGVLIHLMRSEGLGPDQLDELLNRKSGLKGLSGLTNDMREIEAASARGEHRPLLAYKSFCYQVRKYIGAYFAAMGGLDLVVFTGGIGQGSAGVRGLSCQGLGAMGIQVDEDKNQKARGFDEVCDISTEGSPVKVLVVPTNEELMIARETLRAMGRRHIAKIIKTQKPMPVPIEVSAHHVHLTQEHVEALFGKGHQLTRESDLSQPGQFACKEKVTLVGPKGRIERVRVLGPVRKATQVEIAMTEQFKLGVHPPIRESGDVNGTPGLTLEGDAGQVTLDKGVLCAMRHIHMSPEDALKFGLGDRYLVRVRVESERDLIFGDVLIRVHPDFRLAMHIDTDEANAANLATGAIGFIDGIQSQS